jgi:formamidopyrimidine-DNA glycosylase
MPELPEVETIKLQLERKIKGKKIKKVEVKLAKMVRGVSVAKFKKVVRGVKISNIRRRAKLLIINLATGWSLVIHLKITGQLIYQKRPESGEKKKYAHLIYQFTDRTRLLHNDMRQFGYVKLVKTSDLEKLFVKEKFGPEPLASHFTLKKFKEILAKKPRAKIKPLLMDQTFMAGIGNIYAQEACFYARVLPTRKAGTLTAEETSRLYRGIRTILPTAIEDRGSSVDAYVDISGRQGNYEHKLKVYGRKGKKCYRCKSIIKKIKLAGRGTCFCSKCQK